MPDVDTAVHELLDKIEKFGWTFIGVGAGEGEPSFTYTCGLTDKYGHPELVIIGLPPRQAQIVLEEMCAKVRDGYTYFPLEYRDVLANQVPVQLVSVSAERLAARFRFAHLVHSNPLITVRAMQVVWPDKESHFPWDAEFRLPAYAQPIWGDRPA